MIMTMITNIFDNYNGDGNNYNVNNSKKYDGGDNDYENDNYIENNNNYNYNNNNIINNNNTRKMRYADCVERPRKVSRMCYQAVVRHDASKISDHATCSEYDNFPTCCRLEYLAFLDDPEEPVDKGLILIAQISTCDIIRRNTTAYHVLKRAHQLLPLPAHTIDLFTSRFILPFEFQRSNLKEKNEESILRLRTFHREHLTSITAIQ